MEVNYPLKQFVFHLRNPFLILVTFLLCNQEILAQEKQSFLSAEESDPVKMGWMTGFPPPADRTIYFADGSFFQFPALRWSVAHMRQFMPTVNVPKGIGIASTIPENGYPVMDEITFTPLGSNTKMTWKESLSQTYADGIYGRKRSLHQHAGKQYRPEFDRNKRNSRVPIQRRQLRFGRSRILS